MLSKFFPSRSFLVQVGATGTIGMLSDGICQMAVEKQQNYNIFRTLRFGLIVITVTAPFQYFWFRMLARRIGRRDESTLITGVKRMLVDQAVAAPLLTSSFLFLASVAEKPHNVDASIQKTKQLIVPVLLNNYKLWPAVQIINLSLVPLPLRVVVVQFVAMFWNMYVSYTVNKKSEH